jgi:GTP1/Obg family GTP-binding protein
MTNETKQTAVDFLMDKLFDPSMMVDEQLKWFEEAKAMHKKEIINAINTVSENNVKYANMIVSSWSKIEGELFMHNTKLAEQYFNETYGGSDK